MYEIFTYGRFEVLPENEEAFIGAWSEFAAWASTKTGSPTIRLMRDVRCDLALVADTVRRSALNYRTWTETRHRPGI